MLFFWVLIALIFILFLCVLLSLPLTRKQKQKVVCDPSEFGLSYEEISFITSDHILLRGWFIPAADSSTRTIIFLHGYAGSCDPDLKYVPEFHRKGFNVMMFDFRAHGRSMGRFTSLGVCETRDCQAAIAEAISRGSQSIGLLGFSMGGRVAVLTGAETSQVKAIISDGGPARLSTAIAADLCQKKVPQFLANILVKMIELGISIRCGVNLFKNEPLNQAHRLSHLPVLFIHGDHDPYTRIEELETMVKAASPRAECWRIPEAGHRDGDQYRPQEYIQRVTTFFERWLPIGS